MIKYYRKTFTEITAVKITEDNLSEIETFVPVSNWEKDGTFKLFTLYGMQKAETGDYIINDNGEFYICKPDIFEMNYQEITSRKKNKILLYNISRFYNKIVFLIVKLFLTIIWDYTNKNSDSIKNIKYEINVCKNILSRF